MTTVRRWTGHEARALRLALRFSVRGFAEHLGVAVRTVSKWEAGGSGAVPRPDTQAILDTALARADRAAHERFALLREPTDHLAGAGTERACARPRLPAGSEEHLGELVPHLQQLWHVLVRTDNLLGPRFALAGALDQLAIIEELLPLVRGADRGPLVGLAAAYAESAAWLHEDAAQMPESSRWVGRAMEWAHEAGDHRLLAWTLFRRSQHAAASGDGERTLVLVRAARRYGDHLTPPMRAAFVQQEAHGHALNGDDRAAHSALDEALAWAAPDDSGDARGGQGSFCTAAYIELQRASCWAVLGRPDRAIAVFDSVLPTLPPVYRPDRGVACGRLAHAHADAGDPEAAAEVGRVALAIARASDSVRTERAIGRLGRRLAAHRRLESVGSLLSELGPAR